MLVKVLEYSAGVLFPREECGRSLLYSFLHSSRISMDPKNPLQRDFFMMQSVQNAKVLYGLVGLFDVDANVSLRD